MIEKIKKRKDNNFSISHAEQHHRRKGKDKNKRKKEKNSFKDVEFLENNSYSIDHYYNNGHDVVEIHERLSRGEEVKLFDLKTTKRIIRDEKIKNKVGTYKFDNGYILDILSFIDNKNVFLIRKDRNASTTKRPTY